MSVFELWVLQSTIKCYKNIVFDPSYIGGNLEDVNLNKYQGIRAKLLSKDQIDMNKIQIFLDHVSHMNNGEKAPTKYTLDWQASMFQKPAEKNQTALIFNGDQGSGKNLYWQILIGEKIIGKAHYGYVNDLDSLTAQFNSLNCNKILSIADEVTFGGGYKQNNKIKSLISQAWQKFEQKYSDAVMMDDFTNYIFFSNQDWVIRIEKSDRRFLVQRVKNIPSSAYFDKLWEAVNDEERVNMFYTYLMHRDLTGVDLRKIPMTEEKRAMKIYSMDSLELFVDEIKENRVLRSDWRDLEIPDNIEELLENGELDPRCFTGVPTETNMDYLWKTYERYCEEEGIKSTYNKKTFGKSIRNMLKIDNVSKARRNGTRVYMSY